MNAQVTRLTITGTIPEQPYVLTITKPDGLNVPTTISTAEINPEGYTSSALTDDALAVNFSELVNFNTQSFVTATVSGNILILTAINNSASFLATISQTTLNESQ